MATCPLCSADLKLYPRVEQGNATIHLTVVIDDESKMNLLRETLLRYWRWLAEEKRTTLYYDDYRRHLRYNTTQNTYEFAFQVFDSPHGDTWWHGAFQVTSVMEITLVRESYETR